MKGLYFCCDEGRRKSLMGRSDLNGIDFLEVLDGPSVPEEDRQRTLYIHFINPLSGSALTERNVRIDGGERIRNIHAIQVNSQSNILEVEVDRPGDFSTYTLRLVKEGDPLGTPPDNFDPMLSSIDFSFKVNCPSDFDCKQKRICPPEPAQELDINYLAKDYLSFRQLILDRISELVPGWQERNPADMGIALVEMLAYIGDYLSYRQDAVATEAYLGTARSRVSARRHARLVDYFMHDGCSSRVWVQVKVERDLILPGGSRTKLLTSLPGLPEVILPDSAEYSEALAQGPEIFEVMQPHQWPLFNAHNEMYFYTWADTQCCLPKGATRATLMDYADQASRLKLKVGDVLIIKEKLGPETGNSDDADPTHRCAIRLTKVTPEAVDDITINGKPTRVPGMMVVDPLTNQPIVEIEWHTDDAMPFPLCISTKQAPDKVSVALGNIVLADNGLTIKDEPLGQVSEPFLSIAPDPGGDRCLEIEPDFIPPRFRPSLKEDPLTCAAPYSDDSNPSAASAMSFDAGDALPEIYLDTVLGRGFAEWLPSRDLLRSHDDRKAFVVESESNGTVRLRFGDGQNGVRPEPLTSFYATYRVGNGARGNIGAESLKHIVTDVSGIIGISNPLPALGGVDPESIENVRQRAPSAFRVQERAVTLEDYAEIATRFLKVRRAAAAFRWTGSWYTVFLAVEPKGSFDLDSDLRDEVKQFMENYRMAGYDLEVDGPVYVPLRVEICVCIKPDYFRSDVEEALMQVFSNQTMPDGRRGLFHPNNFAFSQPVYLSTLYAAAQGVDGVAWVRVLKFQRLYDPGSDAVQSGVLKVGRQEIVRLDNDPSFPEHGVFRLTLEGGK